MIEMLYNVHAHMYRLFHVHVIMPRCAHAQSRYTVVCLCVCVSVCLCVCVSVECYSCSRINEVQVRVSIGF